MSPSVLVFLLVAAVVALLVAQSSIKARRHEIVAWDWDYTALFVDGRLVRWLDPGRHVVWGLHVHGRAVPRRSLSITAPMQEILTSDGASVRISLSASYRVSDPELYLMGHTSPDSELYDALQQALRTVVADRTLETVATSRAELSALVESLAKERAATLGLELSRVEVRDFAVLGDLRKSVAAVLQAKLDGQAALEKARGETAALRSLANAARMMDDNPNLLNLRLLQTIEGNRQASVVFDPRSLERATRASDSATPSAAE